MCINELQKKSMSRADVSLLASQDLSIQAVYRMCARLLAVSLIYTFYCHVVVVVASK